MIRVADTSSWLYKAPHGSANANITGGKRRRAQSTADIPVEGDPSCPCLRQDQLPPLQPDDLTASGLEILGVPNNNPLDLTTYGFGCATHDLAIPTCAQDPTLDFCYRHFCWVDPNECDLRHSFAQDFLVRNYRFYSYATCRNLDTYSTALFLPSLSGRKFKVGFNHNTGGWVGAFSEKGKNFEGPLDIWSGPILDFVQEGARIANYTIELTPPPDFLLNRSLDFFGGSRFSYCVYATSLGFLDFCIAQYTVTESRGSSADWLMLADQPMRVVIPRDVGSASSHFGRTLALIFRPFEPTAWIFIIVVAIPVLGVLMLFHEYGRPSSAYPVTQSRLQLQSTKFDDNVEIKELRVPIYRHVVRSMYYAFLAVLRGGYENPILTLGAKFNLLGISFFILTLIAVYTANLTAILTQEASVSEIQSFQDVVDQDLRICSIRTGYLTIQSLYGAKGKFVVDPIELGGDGKPGFNCPNCNVAQRVFDFLDPVKAKTDERYCHVAITQEQDLVVLHSQGKHCNKTAVGLAVANAQTGIPIYSGVSRELSAFFLGLQDQGYYRQALQEARPQSQCLADGRRSMVVDSAFTIIKLSGIWVVSFGFAFVGLLVTMVTRFWASKHRSRGVVVDAFDQYGQKINTLRRGDSYVHRSDVSISKRGDRLEVTRSPTPTNATNNSWTSSVNSGIEEGRLKSSKLDRSFRCFDIDPTPPVFLDEDLEHCNDDKESSERKRRKMLGPESGTPHEDFLTSPVPSSKSGKKHRRKKQKKKSKKRGTRPPRSPLP